MNFIKKIFLKQPDEFVHKQFIRFGKGEYRKRAVLSLWKTKTVKIKSSFEFVNDFVLFVAGLGGVTFNGIIWSNEEIGNLQGRKKAGKWVYNVENFTADQVKEIAERTYYFLLNADAPGIKLKIKSKIPKPGKSESKIDVRFCQLELDEKYYRAAKNDFFWDLPECKKANIEHKFIIDEIVLPKTDEEDFAKIRELAKRKGKIIREIDIDGKKSIKEAEFEV
ncbi:MAG TPA: hypothetical protein ENI22_02500 [Candidatus Pacearchaeota archaeon]|nr:hypothetical protein [Candidatus Pacearchaeota archaeon]